MIDKTPLEQQALAAVFRPLGEAVTEIGMNKPLSAYTREEVLTLIEVVVDAYQKYLLDNPTQLKEGVPLTMTTTLDRESTLDRGSSLDFNHRPTLSDKINGLIDRHLQDKDAKTPQRDYLGASRLGVPCSRALQYEYTHTPRDKPFSGKTLRIFEMGHVLEGMALGWLRGAGFDIYAPQENAEPFGFSIAGGRIRGHVDGIIYAAPPETGISFPALWECKSMNAKSWKQTVDKGVRVAKPVYAVQIALYQAYMEGTIPSISQNPALFTAVNKDTSEIYHELVPFDAALAQEASDRGVNILRATQAAETRHECQRHECLPRISNDPDYFECRFCNWKDRCRTNEFGTGSPGKENL